ncbi:hypothetical protein J2749_000694 [Methanobacterium oryzae]
MDIWPIIPEVRVWIQTIAPIILIIIAILSLIKKEEKSK